MEKKVEQIINEGLAKFPEVLREKDIIALQGRLFSYCVMRLRGESHNMAVMLASQSAPKAETDRELFVGIGSLDKQFDGREVELGHVVKQAKSKGYNPQPHDMYISSLARYPGDPKAFVSPSGGRGQIKEVCENRGWQCDGSVKVKGRQAEADPLSGARLADDLADQQIASRAINDPAILRASKKEARQQMAIEHGTTSSNLVGEMSRRPKIKPVNKKKGK